MAPLSEILRETEATFHSSSAKEEEERKRHNSKLAATATCCAWPGRARARDAAARLPLSIAKTLPLLSGGGRGGRTQTHFISHFLSVSLFRFLFLSFGCK